MVVCDLPTGHLLMLHLHRRCCHCRAPFPDPKHLKPPLCLDPDPPSAVRSSLVAETPQELLLDFKASLQDPSDALSAWLCSTPYCNWPHIACATSAAANATVSISISLQGLGLSGELAASSLCRVWGLVTLSLVSNGFNQTILLELSCCASPASLNLSADAFWGRAPSS
jgi:hypothetical protein